MWPASRSSFCVTMKVHCGRFIMYVGIALPLLCQSRAALWIDFGAVTTDGPTTCTAGYADYRSSMACVTLHANKTDWFLSRLILGDQPFGCIPENRPFPSMSF